MDPEWFEAATAGSAVGREARAVDWERTPLGPPSGWPVALRHAVRLCYSTHFPVMMVWGPDLTLIYNDGYRGMLGTDKHPAALGAPATVVWDEIWDEIGPLFERVLTTGEPTWSRDLPLLMNRSGYTEETYFTFSYSPLLDDDGRVAGVLDIATETTQEVVNQRRLSTVGQVHAVLPTTYEDVPTFVGPALEVMSRSADISRVAVYDAEGGEVLLETGQPPEEAEQALVERALATGLRVTSRGVVVKPVRSGLGRGILAVLVLRATSLRPWDADYARFLAVLATNVAAALRDGVRRRANDDALRLRARRSEEERARATEVSLALQRAVLSNPPQLDGLEVVVHYQPAAAGRDIGGDWYDAFVTRDGATTLVIGDVVGHDLDAAVAMGQLRALVRAIGYDSQETPARVLERVDAAIDGLAFGGAATATVLVARIEQTEEQRRRGVRTVRWSSAGHLPPVLARADGTSEVLWIHNDLVLGLAPTTSRTDHTVDLRDGDTLVLYTDGLVENRTDSLRRRVEALAAMLDGTHGAAMGDVVSDVLAGMLPGAVEDDVAIVAVRVRPEAAARAGASSVGVAVEAGGGARPDGG
ncbi:SpoIIE family protein phosphatase [Isoptericola sp. 4D.3]|uniref:SpoIIE family protein phosphatase n=1 Tax=Isoptericola peretonis TaxID=2918523 RepID=A0ABT0J561_9MICO|nr:SpoIIE family protein phosphatase [Isoptericola sp. 4D.3]